MDKLFSFDVVLENPEGSHRISISPGHGIARDGILDRYGNQLNTDDLEIHSYASEEGADLAISPPTNYDVGLYTLYITAEDQRGQSITAPIPLEIQNINDIPTLNKAESQKLSMQIGEVREQKLLHKSINLFTDPDLIHSEKYRDYLI